MGIAVKGLTWPVRAVGAGLKAFAMSWPKLTSWASMLLPRTKFDYAREVGDGTGSSIVMACVGWIMRTFPEAPVVVVEVDEAGRRQTVHGHALSRKIERPNPYYSGPLMWMATCFDWELDGNAYWLKERSAAGGVERLWWAPSWTMEPKGSEDGKTFITHYEYKPDQSSEPIRVEPRDVVHFRNGLDSHNPRKGMSQLKSVMREIFTDDEAANFTAALMKNLGIPGVILSPAKDSSMKFDPDQAAKVKSDFRHNYGGDNRGEPLVFSGPTDVKVLSFSPEQMTLRDLRRVPEERCSAIFGVAAIVVGLGAGLDRSTFTNFHEAREAAYEQKIIPTQRLMAADLSTQLLPDFDEAETRLVAFDLAQVRVLQPDLDKLFERMSRGVLGGFVMISDAKRAVGLPVNPGDDVYLRPLSLMAVAPGDRSGPSVAEAANAIGSLVRAGFDPPAVLSALGMPEIEHTGALPITATPLEALTTNAGGA